MNFTRKLQKDNSFILGLIYAMQNIIVVNISGKIILLLNGKITEEPLYAKCEALKRK